MFLSSHQLQAQRAIESRRKRLIRSLAKLCPFSESLVLFRTKSALDILRRIEEAVKERDSRALSEWHSEMEKGLEQLDHVQVPEEYAMVQGRYDELDFFVNPDRFQAEVKAVKAKTVITKEFTDD